MAAPREIEDVRKDPDKWRLIMRQLLRYDREALSDELLDFIERLLSLPQVDVLTYRQGEWLLDVRDKVKIVSTFRDFSLKALIQRCYEQRLDLSEAAQEWIENLVERGRSEIRLYEARKIYRIAYSLGEVDHDDFA